MSRQTRMYAWCLALGFVAVALGMPEQALTFCAASLVILALPRDDTK